MKRLITLVFLLAAAVLCGSVSYNTYTVGIGSFLVKSQEAFEPTEVLYGEFLSPEDLFVRDGKLYVADSGNSRIAVLDGKEVSYLAEWEVLNPQGIYVDETGTLYIADSWARNVYKYDGRGVQTGVLSRPDSPLYGKSNDFIPLKVAADRRGNVYVLSQGVTNGLVVFNRDGKFVGFFGANEPDVTLRMILQRLFFTQSQKEQLLRIKPPSPGNLVVEDSGLVWTVTTGLTDKAIKRFNVAGTNIYGDLDFSSSDFIDLDIDAFGNVYALSSTGLIFIYDSYGNLLFLFGGQSYYENRRGLLRSPVAIDVAGDGRIYVLDKEDGTITVFSPTAFGSLVLKGVSYYNQGMYLEGEAIWREVQKLNSSFLLTYKVLGNIEFKRDNYGQAFDYFSLAQDKRSYSEAFWHLRNDWLQKVVGLLFVALVALAVFDLVRSVLKRQGKIKPRARAGREIRFRLFRELKASLKFLKNPFDAVYEMKRNGAVSFSTATLLYIWMYVQNVLILYLASPLFVGFRARNIDFLALFYDTYRLLFLWIVGNFLVSEISEGEGTFKHIYIGTIEAFLPILLFALPLALVTNLLTLNEAFIYTFSMQALNVWSLVMLLIIISQVHNFTFGETVKNVLLTLFAMLLLAMLIFLVIILLREEIDFFLSIVQELIFHAG